MPNHRKHLVRDHDFVVFDEITYQKENSLDRHQLDPFLGNASSV